MDDNLMRHVDKTFNVGDGILTKMLVVMLAAVGTARVDVELHLMCDKCNELIGMYVDWLTD
jgi:hypothetical protein